MSMACKAVVLQMTGAGTLVRSRHLLNSCVAAVQVCSAGERHAGVQSRG